MLKPKFDVQSMRVASPCSVGWDEMTGDDRVRHCDSCQLNIYNTAEMTTQEIESLVQKREDRLCIRLYRRADGTVLTKDCPVGLRAVRQRAARFASASLATVLGLFSLTYGQTNEPTKPSGSSVASSKEDDGSNLSGTICDPNGAVIPGAVIRAYRIADKKRLKKSWSTVSNADGSFEFKDMPVGTYELVAELSGFSRSTVQNVEVVEGKKVAVKVLMLPGGASITVGIISEPPLIDMSSSGITTTVFRRKID